MLDPLPRGSHWTWKRLLALVAAVHRRVAVGHTIHAVPFAAIGALLVEPRWPGLRTVILLFLCVLFGRATVVGFLRFFEAPADVVTPDDPPPDLPEQEPPPRPVWLAFALHGAFMMGFCAWLLRPVAGYLSIPYTLLLLLYAATRRFTGCSHFLLGAGLGAGPIATWVALGGSFADLWPGLVLLASGITLWAAGFDMVFSLKPELRQARGPGRFARAMRFPPRVVLRIAWACQAASILLFLPAGPLLGLGPTWFAGPVLVGVVLTAAALLLRRGFPERIAGAWVRLNLLTGPILLAVTLLAL